MSIDVASLYKRYNALEQEVNYIQRKRKEEGEQIVAALKSIPEEQIERIREFAPDIVFLKECTVEDFISNKDGALNRLQKMYSELTHLADTWLKNFEDGLC